MSFHVPPSVAENAHRHLDQFAELLIEGGSAGPSISDRIEEAANTIIADLRQADAPADLVADVLLNRDRAVFLVELVYAQLREIEDAVAGGI